jgi:hypothetical protein
MWNIHCIDCFIPYSPLWVYSVCCSAASAGVGLSNGVEMGNLVENDPMRGIDKKSKIQDVKIGKTTDKGHNSKPPEKSPTAIFVH